MNVHDLLRKLADTIASAEQEDQIDEFPYTDADIIVDIELDSSEPANANTSDTTGVFVPPLQAKLELLKKAVDVDNVYDRSVDDEDIGKLKMLSGIIAASDDSLDN